LPVVALARELGLGDLVASGSVPTGDAQKLGSDLGSRPGDKTGPLALTKAMDSSSTPGQTVRLLLEIDRAPDGRLEGLIGTDGADAWSPFSGVLELLKVLEEHT